MPSALRTAIRRPRLPEPHRVFHPEGHAAFETSDAANLSSGGSFRLRDRGVGEGPGRVVGLAGAQAVVQLAEHAVEQVPPCSGVTVAAVAVAQVVLPG
jgi:hypothetical protein